MEFWFWAKKIEGEPVNPRDMTDDQKRELLEWMRLGPKYGWDSLRWLNESSRTAQSYADWCPTASGPDEDATRHGAAVRSDDEGPGDLTGLFGAI